MVSDLLISVIIPTLDNPVETKKIISVLNQQTVLPKEIIICDSSSSDKIEETIKSINSKIQVVYVRAGRAFPFDRIIHKYKSLIHFGKDSTPERIGRAFPYEASNIGAIKAKYEWIAFIDTTTEPKKNWLEEYSKIIRTENINVVFGNTKYLAQTSYQKLLRASTYGRRGHETAPGTLMRKEDFISSGKIIEGVRSGGDIEWRERVKLNFKCHTPKKVFLNYSPLPKNLASTGKKFFIYQLYGARLNIQNKVKDIYLGLLLILSAIVIPQWNGIVGWEDSPLYWPYVTRIYAIGLIIIFLSTLIINKGILRKAPHSFFLNVFKTIIFIFVFIAVFRWNEVVANWVEESVWYIPNITKIYVGVILITSVIYRGLYFPLTNNVKKEYLFPFRWISVGLLGLFLDAIKAPGYVIGSLTSPFTKKIN